MYQNNMQQRRVGDGTAPYGYNGGYNAGTSSTQEADRAAAEKENDAILKALMSDIKTIKTTNKSIGQEIGRQNQLLDLLNDSFIKAQGALGKAMKKVGEVGGMSSHKHMWLLVVFAFFVFLFIWFMLKLR